MEDKTKIKKIIKTFFPKKLLFIIKIIIII